MIRKYKHIQSNIYMKIIYNRITKKIAEMAENFRIAS